MQKCDTAKTVAHVKFFFENDFWHYINQGGAHITQLSSPQMDLAGGGHSNTNGTEKALISEMSRAEQARYTAETILLAVNDCTDYESSKHKTIIRNSYIDNVPDFQLEAMLGFSNYQVRKEKKQAAIEFAERLNFWKKYRNINDLPDLLYFKSTNFRR
ncbi:MAG: ArpU family phage packaging/lysis transcriptional regulator [Lactobacillus kalixensis]|uniref:ArpU family phage packaging/lysis transcriptional regulator n=1 Tax=Lactobacillus kalixensis TaxID=227944 RepID=UPI0039952D22